MRAGKTKECPFCAETIKAAARGCRYCGTVFAPGGGADAGVQALSATGALPSPTMIAEPEVSDLIAGLVEKSLVLYEEDEHGQGRYRLLETVRQYSRDRLLESYEGGTVRSRHGQFFLRLAEETEPKLRGPEQQRWLVRLKTEYDNCRAALEWAQGESVETGLRLATALTTLWARWGHDREAREWLARALASDTGELSAARVKALISAGKIAFIQGDGRAARSFLEAGLRGAEATGDRLDLMVAHGHMVVTLAPLGEIESARDHAAECETLGREIGTDWARAFGGHHVGYIRLYEHDFSTAADYFHKNLSAFRQDGDRWHLGFSYLFLARAAYYLGDRSTMRARLDEAQSVFEELEMRFGLAWVLLSRGVDADDQGDHRAAAALYEESLQLFRELEAVRGQAHAFHHLGRLARLAHDFDAARSYLRESLEIFAATGNASGISRALSGLASLALAEGEPVRAARLFGAAAVLPELSEPPLFDAARADHERCLEQTRTTLGEAAFAAAWSEGQAQPLEQALECALDASWEGHA